MARENRRLVLWVSSALFVAVIGAGCGGHRGSAHIRAPARPATGGAIFARSCSSCHTVTGHEQGAPGGDLGYTVFTVAEIAGFAKIMPVKPPLSDRDAHAVAEYIRRRAASLHGRS